MTVPRPPNTIDSIMSRFKRDESGCLLWSGRISRPDGYVRVRYNGRERYVHVIAYIAANGREPPEDKPVVCHTCDVRHCGEPSHLFAGTQADNIADRDAKGRTSKGEHHGEIMRARVFTPSPPMHGAASPRAKLTDSDVRYILSPESRRERTGLLAARLGVSRKTISQIRKGERWPHLHAELLQSPAR